MPRIKIFLDFKERKEKVDDKKVYLLPVLLVLLSNFLIQLFEKWNQE